jgi:hypothetical protein
MLRHCKRCNDDRPLTCAEKRRCARSCEHWRMGRLCCTHSMACLMLVARTVKLDQHAPLVLLSTGGSALKPPPLRNLQQELQSGVEELLQRQRLQLRTEEASQLRLFRQQLTELDAQLSAGEKREAVQQGTTASELVSCGNGSKHTYPCMLISRIPWWHSASAADCVQKLITSFAPTTQRGFSA